MHTCVCVCVSLNDMLASLVSRNFKLVLNIRHTLTLTVFVMYKITRDKTPLYGLFFLISIK